MSDRPVLVLDEPFPAQWEIHQSLDNYQFVLLLAGRRFSKTQIGIDRAVIQCMEKANQIAWWVAPSIVVGRRAYNRFEILLAPLVPSGRVRFQRSERTIVFPYSKSRLEFYTAINPDAMVGEGVNWCGVDEAGLMPDDIFYTHIFPPLMDTGGQLFAFGTPRKRNWFYTFHERGKKAEWQAKGWKSHIYTSHDNPFADKEMLELAKQIFPEARYRREIMAEWTDEAGTAFPGYEKCVDQGLRLDSTHDRPTMGPYAIGVDLGRQNDYTAVVVIDRLCRVAYVERKTGGSWDDHIDMIARIVRRYSGSALVDSTGIGDPVFQGIEKTGIPCERFRISSNREKINLVEVGIVAIERQAVRIPGDAIDLIEELQDYGYDIDDNNIIRFSAPSSGHDDCVIAFLLALMNYRKTISGEAGLPIMQFYDETEWVCQTARGL